MGSKLSRRSLLKAMGLGAGATILGWRPALSPLGTPLSSNPTVPVILGPTTQSLGHMVTVSDLDLVTSGLDLVTLAEDMVRRAVHEFGEKHGMVPASDEVWFHVPPGASHYDPLAQRHTVGMKQLWRPA